MNVQLKDITVTARDGRVSHLDQVYIRGSHVRFFIVPDMLKYVFASLYIHIFSFPSVVRITYANWVQKRTNVQISRRKG
jgi:hypothetical protein